MFPEDRLISKFFRRNLPEVMPAVGLRDGEPYYARRLARKQLELMEGGASEAQAYEEVVGERERELRVQMGRAALEQLQLEEERVLAGGLERALEEGSLDPAAAEPERGAAGKGKPPKSGAKGRKSGAGGTPPGDRTKGKGKEGKEAGGKAGGQPPSAKKSAGPGARGGNGSKESLLEASG